MGRWWRPKRSGSAVIRDLERELSAGRDNAQGYVRLGDLHQKRGALSAAVDAYWRAVTIYGREGRERRAVAVLRTIVQLAPDSTRAHLSLARALELIDRKRDAALQFAVLGRLCEKKGVPARALEAYEKSLSLYPDQPGLSGKVVELRHVMTREGRGLTRPAEATAPHEVAPEDLLLVEQDVPGITISSFEPVSELPS